MIQDEVVAVLQVNLFMFDLKYQGLDLNERELKLRR
jgi:hypothetical protein